MAEKLVRDEGLALPIDVLRLAHSRDIHVEAKPADAGGVSGMLIRVGESYSIAYATHIRSEGFQRFSIAHELGHYFLDGHPEAVFRTGTVHESHAGFEGDDQIELEADHFAAGLLMPSHLFEAAASRFDDGMDAVKGLADVCKTSLTAAAIRYAQLGAPAIAIILSRGSTVDFCFASEAMRRSRGYRHQKKGSILPRNSVTRDFNLDHQNVLLGRDSSDSTELNVWFHTDDEIDASEEVLGLGEYGRTLTVITAEIPDLDDESEDRSWKSPGFR
ncbi:MAG: ImmA/IrrE family metallo-endopeptidase [Massilia sp.]|nr:ImmA/IrrE family metallo-endopeptidase [Massilia sp.]